MCICSGTMQESDPGGGFPKCRSTLVKHLEGIALSVTWWGTLGELCTFTEAIFFFYLWPNLAFLTDLILEFTTKGFKGNRKGGDDRGAMFSFFINRLLRLLACLFHVVSAVESFKRKWKLWSPHSLEEVKITGSDFCFWNVTEAMFPFQLESEFVTPNVTLQLIL